MSHLGGLYIHSPLQWTVEIYLIIRLLLHFWNILYNYLGFYTSVELCGTLRNPLEHTLEKSREIQGILEYFRAARGIKQLSYQVSAEEHTTLLIALIFSGMNKMICR